VKFYSILLFIEARGRSQITSRFRGERGIRICDSQGDSPNTKFSFLWKICDKEGGGGFEKVVFFA